MAQLPSEIIVKVDSRELTKKLKEFKNLLRNLKKERIAIERLIKKNKI